MKLIQGKRSAVSKIAATDFLPQLRVLQLKRRHTGHEHRSTSALYMWHRFYERSEVPKKSSLSYSKFIP